MKSLSGRKKITNISWYFLRKFSIFLILSIATLTLFLINGKITPTLDAGCYNCKRIIYDRWCGSYDCEKNPDGTCKDDPNAGKCPYPGAENVDRAGIGPNDACEYRNSQNNLVFSSNDELSQGEKVGATETTDVDWIVYEAYGLNKSTCTPNVPGTLSGSCPAPGASASLSWSAGTGNTGAKTPTYYKIRIDDWDNWWCNRDENGDGINEINNCSNPPNCTEFSGDYCNDNITSTSYNYSTTTGHTYNSWLHACNDAGCGNNNPGTSFNCPAVTGDINANPTSCTIAIGGTTCDSSISWTTNVTSNVSVKRINPGSTTENSFSTDVSSAGTNGSFSRGDTTFVLRYGTTELDRVTVTANSTPLPAPTVSPTTCTTGGTYTVDLSWTDTNVNEIQISNSSTFAMDSTANTSYKSVTRGTTTFSNVPTGFSHMGSSSGLSSFTTGSTYWVRLFDNGGSGRRSTPLSFTRSACPTPTPTNSPTPTPTPTTAPSIQSLQVGNNPGRDTTFTSTLIQSGRLNLAAERGKGWYNPLTVKLVASKGSGDFNLYWVAFYPNTLADPTASTFSNIWGASGINGDSSNGFMLAYVPAGAPTAWPGSATVKDKFYAYGKTSTTAAASWVDITDFGTGQDFYDSSGLVLKIKKGSSGDYYAIWEVSLYGALGSKTFKTAGAVWDSSSDPTLVNPSAFSANLAPSPIPE